MRALESEWSVWPEDMVGTLDQQTSEICVAGIGERQHEGQNSEVADAVNLQQRLRLRSGQAAGAVGRTA
jgi:hypothetical protein